MPRDLEALKESLKPCYRADKYIERLFYPENPLPLEKCYLSLALITEKEMREVKGSQAGEAGSGEAAEAGTRERQHCLHEYDRIQHIQKKLEVNAMLNECGEPRRRIYIEGAAGAGKSTLSRFLAHEWACDKAPWSAEYDWVFYLRLRDLAADRYAHVEDLFRVLNQELFVGDGHHLTEEELSVFQTAVRADPSKVLWILDGYDEVNPVILSSGWWRDLVASQYHLLMTSRPGTALVKREVGINLELAILGLTDDQVKEYLGYFFDLTNTPDIHRDDQKRCLSFLKSQLELWSLAHTPILLEMLCSSWQELSKISVLTLTHLYEVVLEQLLKRRAMAEGIAAEALSREFLETRYEVYLHYMEHLAFLGMVSRSPVIQQERMDQAFAALPAGVRGDVNFYKNLRALGLVKRYNNGRQAEFAHLTFQEFFAARYVAKSVIAFSEGEERGGYLPSTGLLGFIKEHKWHGFYEVMWWFVGGLLRNGKEAVLENYTYTDGDRNNSEELVKLPHSHLCLQALHVFFDLLLQEPRAELEIFELLVLAKCLVEAGMPNVMQREAIKLHLIRWLDFFMFQPKINFPTDIREKVFAIIKTTPEISRWIEPLLLSRLEDQERGVRQAAADAVRKLGSGASEALQAGLMPLLNDSDPGVRWAAADAVGKLGSGASTALQEVLLPLLKDSDRGVCQIAARAVGMIGSSASEALQEGLLPLLKDLDWFVRQAAADAVGKFGPSASAALQLGLLPLLKDSDPDVRWAAADAVGKLGAGASEALQEGLLPLLKDSDPGVRQTAADAVGKLGSSASEALQLGLLPLLKDSDMGVRQAAAWAVGKLGTHASAALQLGLLPLLNDSDPGVREAAAGAIGSIGSSASEALQLGLLPLVHDADRNVKNSAIDA